MRTVDHILARQDPARLAALRRLNVLDAPADEAFDRLTRLAVKLLGVPAAFVSLVDEDRDFYLSHCGFAEPLASARQLTGETFCHFAIVSQGPLVIEDTRAHPVFRTVPTVESLGVAAYLGIPIRLNGEAALGSLCVIDLQPRRWSQQDVEVLTELAASVRTEIELRAEVAERRKARVLLAAGQEILERIARGDSLARVLHDLTCHVERQMEGARCSILMLDAERRTLRVLAAPHLPPEYSEAIDGIPVREGVGSCGTAAHRNAPVVVADIASDPLWNDFRELARQHDLAACWSYPVRASDGSVLGTFAMYAPRSCEPSLGEFEVVERAAHMASIAIETARRNAELGTANARLRESETQLRSLLEHTPIGLYRATERGFVSVNPALVDILGYPDAEALLAAPMDEFVVDPQERVRRIERLLRDGALQNLEGRLRRRDGRLIWARESARVVYAEDGAMLYVDGSIEDITEHKETELAIRESEGRFRAIFEGSMDAVFLYGFGDDGRPTSFLEVNRIACERLGYSREELLRRSFHDLAPPERPITEAFVSNLVERLFADGHWMTQSVHLARDGRRIPVEVNARLIDLQGRPTVVAIARDISERQQMEAQLRQAQKMEAVGRLAGGVAHDFNNMLTAIKGFASLLEMELEPGARHHEYLEQIQGAADHSVGLTRQLLAFSRKQVLKPERLDLNTLISRTQTMLRRLIGEDIYLLAHLDASVGRVLADPGQMEQVIVNLALNARDAMDGGGRLVLKTRRRVVHRHEPHREGFEIPAGRYAVLSISDTGHGMPPETMTRMFEPFFTTKEVGKGTGLGLSTVYGIIKQSGGYIWADSRVGQGSTFHILLPEVETGAEQPVDRSAGGALSRGSGTVLLVEDESAVRLLVQKVLERSGYAVMSASSGSDALQLLSGWSGTLDMLLTDVVMPGGSGQELAREVRERHPGAKVLFMSGYADEAVERHGVLAEQSHFIQKPFPPNQLTRKVAQVLGTGGRA